MRKSTRERLNVRAREKEYKRAFDFIDRDGSGQLDVDELAVLFKLVGQSASKNEIEQLIKTVDNNGDGKVDFEEFVQMLEREKRQKDESDLRQYFNVFDEDRKGYISAERLKRSLDQMGEPVTLGEAQAMIRYADVNGDGKVTMDDFMASFVQHL